MLSPSTITWPAATSEWMGKVYRFLGLTVGLVVHGVDGDAAGRLQCRCHLRHQQRVRL